MEGCCVDRSANRQSLPGEVAIGCDAALAGVSWSYLAFAYAAAEFHLPYVRVCPYALLTGGPCPLCGSTRFIGALLHGRLIETESVPVAVVWLITVVCIAAISLVPVWKHIRRAPT